jgi:hypothetical protein
VTAHGNQAKHTSIENHDGLEVFEVTDSDNMKGRGDLKTLGPSAPVHLWAEGRKSEVFKRPRINTAECVNYS